MALFQLDAWEKSQICVDSYRKYAIVLVSWVRLGRSGGGMPRVDVVFYVDERGSAPVLEWLDEMPSKVRDKFIVRVERLRECGSDLRRPEADLLRDGIYELRVRNMRVNYRILYFFHGPCAVLAHGLTKEDEVPGADIDRAIARRGRSCGSPEGTRMKNEEENDNE